MKKLFIIFILHIVSTGLSAKILYADFGIGNDITKINFTSVLSDNTKVTENLTGQSSRSYTIPNLNYSLGVRLHRRVIIFADIQSFELDEYFNYRVELEKPSWVNPLEADYNLHIKSFGFYGVGIIIYPHDRLHLRVSQHLGFSGYSEEVITNDKIRKRQNVGIGDGYNISIAYDKQIKKIGILMGFRYFNADITHKTFLGTVHPEYKVSSFGLYAKIRY